MSLDFPPWGGTFGAEEYLHPPDAYKSMGVQRDYDSQEHRNDMLEAALVEVQRTASFVEQDVGFKSVRRKRSSITYTILYSKKLTSLRLGLLRSLQRIPATLPATLAHASRPTHSLPSPDDTLRPPSKHSGSSMSSQLGPCPQGLDPTSVTHEAQYTTPFAALNILEGCLAGAGEGSVRGGAPGNG